jgi:hypothetical protein
LKGQKFSSGACMQRNFVLYNNYVFYMLKLWENSIFLIAAKQNVFACMR